MDVGNSGNKTDRIIKMLTIYNTEAKIYSKIIHKLFIY